jgi:phosphoribosylaminoimidazole-succinocarboxamide synthase
VLTKISEFWFEKTRTLVPNHLTTLRIEDIVQDSEERAQLAGRSMVVKKLRALPIEAVVRGYLIGSGYKDYKQHRSVCGIDLPAGLAWRMRCPNPSSRRPRRRPPDSTTRTSISRRSSAWWAASTRRRPAHRARRLRPRRAQHARARDIIIADTKFEFGVDKAGNLMLIDEVLTPDSSRFWPVASYRTGISPPSFDKQFVRDYLESLHWNKKPPAPHLPPDIIARTSDNYRKALNY